MTLILKSIGMKNSGKVLADADSARDRRDWREASKLYKEAIELQPSDAAVWVQYGHALKESGQILAAESAYRKSIEINPNSSDAYLQLGHALKLGGKLGEAKLAYEAAVGLDPENFNASKELAAIKELDSSRDDAFFPTIGGHGKESNLQNSRVLFDCSDLIQYFRDNRLPTGIQRVQINIVTSYLSIGAVDQTVVIYFDTQTRSWRQIFHNDFQRLVNSAQRTASVSEKAWGSIRSQICDDSAPTFRFVRGDAIINLGTSWWIPDYFLLIRTLKEKWGVYYVPFIHDCIPLVTPEYCAAGLTNQFRSWLAGVFAHSDGYLVNSQSTARDLVMMAGEFGYEIPAPKVVRLDGDTQGGGQFHDESAGVEAVEAILDREHIPSGAPYVLMVGTLEIRKNHTLALKVWDKLIAERGKNCPFLICVGKKGWHFDVTEEYFAAHRRLAGRVRFISDVSDAVLAQLYRGAEFTLYPSHYEGWGLPVTESLCYGKLPVVADNSSLTEAGGEFAEYFESGSVRQAHAAVAKLLDEPSYRKARENNVASRFAPRPWTALSQEIVENIDHLRKSGKVQLSGFPRLVTGSQFALKQYDAAGASSGQLSAEHARVGGWHQCEDWGTWMSANNAALGFAVDRPLEKALLFLVVRGNPTVDLNLTVSGPDGGHELRFLVPAARDTYLKVPIGRVEPGSLRKFILGVDRMGTLQNLSEGYDARNAGAGVIWLAMAEEADFAARLTILEAISCSVGTPLH